MDRRRGDPGSRTRSRVRNIIQRLVERASIPRLAVEDRLGPEDLSVARRRDQRPAREGDPRRRHLPDLLRPHDTSGWSRDRVKRSQGRRVVAHRRDEFDQEGRR